MTYILAASKQNNNVLTTTNPNDFIFHSSFNTFKILSTNTYSPILSVSSSETFTTVSHGQSTTPFVLAFCKFNDGRVGLVGDRASNVEFWFSSLKVDATYIYFGYVNNTGGNYQPIWRYYIFEVPL